MASRLIILFSLFSVPLWAQFASPISWSFEQEALGEDRFELTITATAEDGWAVYSQHTDPGGPVPTTFYWEEGDHYALIGGTEESGHRKEGLDDLFGVNVIKYLSDEPVVFTQTVRVSEYGTPIGLEVEFMCCDDEQCLPPTTEEYRFTLQPVVGRTEVGNEAPAPPPRAPVVQDAIADVGQRAIDEVEPVDMPQEEVLETFTASLPPANQGEPVSWTIRAEALDGGRYRMSLTGSMAEGWTLYSMHVDPTVGPIPTELFVEEKPA